MKINMLGKRFGKLVAIKRVADRHNQDCWVFRCDCKNTKEIWGPSVRRKRGNTTSCGCVHKEQLRQRMTTHGHTSGGKPTKEYSTWARMIVRCEDPKSADYKNYGGRGIRVCRRWRRSFANFFSDMGFRPPKTSIERINNDKGYSPGNCKWATSAEQARNRRNVVKVTRGGETMVVADWAVRLGVKPSILGRRMKRLGLSLEDAAARMHGGGTPVTHAGETMSIAGWERRLGIKHGTLQSRMNRQRMSFEQAISKPIRRSK